MAIVALVLLFLAFRWNNFALPLVRDEGEYAYSAHLLKDNRLPYEDAFLQKPPMIVYAYALAYAIAPSAFWAPRILAHICVALSLAALWWIARLEFGTRVAWPTVWIALPMVTLPALEQFTANTEMFMLLPLLLATFGYVLLRKNSREVWAWLLAGSFGAAAFWFKYTALPILLVLFGGMAIQTLMRHIDRARVTGSSIQLLKCAGVVLRGCILALAGAALATTAIIIPFLWRDGGKHLWECTVQFNRLYAASATFSGESFWICVGPMLAQWWIIFLLPLGLFHHWRRRDAFWVIMFLAGWLGTGGSVYGHYYIPLLPFWALLSACGISKAADLGRRWFSWPGRWTRCVLTAAAFCLISRSHLPWISISPDEFAARRYAGLPFIEAQPAGKIVAQITKPSDTVYVAGSEPEILFYAHRRCATRFVIAYPLTLPSPVAFGYQREAITAFESNKPAVVIFVQNATSWLLQKETPNLFMPFLQKALETEYQRCDGFVPGVGGGVWKAQLDDSEAPNASLIIFQRKKL